MNVCRYLQFIRIVILDFRFFFSEEGGIEVLVGKNVPLFLYGNGLTDKTEVIFTSAKGKISSPSDAFLSNLHIKKLL